MSRIESRAPSSYDELVSVLESLPVLVREKRRRLRLTMRAAERDTGVGMSTFSRVENGHDMALTTALDLLRWVGTPDVPAEPAVPTHVTESDDVKES